MQTIMWLAREHGQKSQRIEILQKERQQYEDMCAQQKHKLVTIQAHSKQSKKLFCDLEPVLLLAMYNSSARGHMGTKYPWLARYSKLHMPCTLPVQKRMAYIINLVQESFQWNRDFAI